MPELITTTLRSVSDITWSPTRRREPVTIGIPFSQGTVKDPREICLTGPEGRIPIQVKPLDVWPDGSTRWALIDTFLDAVDGRPHDYAIGISPDAALPATDLRIVTDSRGVEISTGRATFGFKVGGRFPFSSVTTAGASPAPPLIDEDSGLEIVDDRGVHRYTITNVQVRERGPIRAEVDVRGAIQGSARIVTFARIEVFSDSATVRIHLMHHNPRRARHAGGRWPLGDEGSEFFRSSTLRLALAGAARAVACAPERNAAPLNMQLPFDIHQESSGGDRWNGPVHRNRYGDVPLRFPGYRRQSGRDESMGHRADPIVTVDTERGHVGIAVPYFWENFPLSIGVNGQTIEIRLFPRTADLHELQGGEQKTYTVVIAFERDAVSDPPMAWVHNPLRVYPAPEWCCATGVIPFLEPAEKDPHADYLGLVSTALDPVHGFVAKRESADEYGWRNFGDLYADHESAFQPPDRPFVSHYNNQYDAIAGFAIHFLRTGDGRWWQLCDDLARHVRDVDIYHTRHDKAAYNGGLFWHTLHYADAGTSSHRTYPLGAPESGGPAAEHNYNTGLMWHFLMTGERASRDAAVGLADWVLAMEDGDRTPFRWLARGATGLATATGSTDYHGPGRAGGNSILACLVGYQLTADTVYLGKAEELIRRCVHPDQDIEALNLLDVERRWYYTVFLQALGHYLHMKQQRQQFDEMFSYARRSLLHFARWMAANERPYLDHKAILEFPTETWAAQDLRKADVFFWAALHAGVQERPMFLERAGFFRGYSMTTLAAMPTHRFTRPIVLLLVNGFRQAWNGWNTLPAPAAGVSQPETADMPASRFESQKSRAMRRGRWLGVALLAGLLIAGAALTLGRI